MIVAELDHIELERYIGGTVSKLDVIEADVGGDAGDPGTELIAAVEATESLVDPQKAFRAASWASWG